MKILDVEGVSSDKYKDADVFREHEEGRCYDLIITYRSLSKLTLPNAITQFEEWAAMLEPGGVIYLFEHSAEWFAYEVIGGRMTPIAELHMFGDETEVYHSAWTLMMLRSLLDKAGLIPENAVTRDYVVVKTDGDQPIMAKEHYVAARKPSLERPA